jgi:hypothetical protein
MSMDLAPGWRSSIAAICSSQAPPDMFPQLAELTDDWVMNPHPATTSVIKAVAIARASVDSVPPAIVRSRPPSRRGETG